MELQSVSVGLPSMVIGLLNKRSVSHEKVSTRCVGYRGQSVRLSNASKSNLMKNNLKGYPLLNWMSRGAIMCSSSSNSEAKLESFGRENSGVSGHTNGGVEPFRGNSGSISFHGLTHQLIEEGKLMSAPFDEEKGSLLWMLAPAALISSLILPQFFLSNAIEEFLKNEILVEIVNSFVFEGLFYVGLSTFLLLTDRVQRPYLEFSSKRWGLITGLKGYLTSAFLTTGFKFIAPLFAVSVTWPIIGLPAFISVLPFLVGCIAQFAFETSLQRRRSSCWPLVPIVFEIYRLYQLTKAAHFMERLMFGMKGVPTSSVLVEKSNAFFSMIVTFQVLGMVCLWSLMTFLVRLFPSRPVAENY